jgi:hypothetical protein
MLPMGLAGMILATYAYVMAWAGGYWGYFAPEVSHSILFYILLYFYVMDKSVVVL